MKPSQILVIIFCLSLILIAAGCTDSKNTPSETTSEQPTPNTGTPSDQNLTVHFLNVDQGDSIILTFNGKSILIDAGESDQGEVVFNYMKDQRISTPDYIVASHPYSDHIGGRVDILNNFNPNSP
jgi:Predicted hydrolase (metallo-beta-lactamase superfamily)